MNEWLPNTATDPLADEEDLGGALPVDEEVALSAASHARLEVMRTQGRGVLVPKVCVLCGNGFEAIVAYPPVCRTVGPQHSALRHALWPTPALYTAAAL